MAARAAACAAGYLLLVLFGNVLREDAAALPIVWPAQGLLVAVLWNAPARHWPFVLLCHLSVGQLAAVWLGWPGGPGQAAFADGARFLDAGIGAALARLALRDVAGPRVAQVVRCFMGFAAGAAAGATVGAWASMTPQADYMGQWQLWWAGHLLGSMALAPPLLCWTLRLRHGPPAIPDRTTIRAVLVQAVLVIAATVWVFSVPAGEVSTILQLPFVLTCVLAVAAFVLPLRWTTSIAASAALLAALLAGHGFGPFSDAPATLDRIGMLQWFLASELTVPLLLGVGLFEQLGDLERVGRSEQRYRSFVELSAEAVWRVEIDPPMPLELPPDAQLAWFEAHARLAESNPAARQPGLVTRDETTGAAPAPSSAERAVPWSEAMLESLPRLAVADHAVDGVPFDFEYGGARRRYLANLRGVVTGGRLCRVWGMARDVTTLLTLNAQLRRDQARLRAYAHALSDTEDRERRATAAALHDGIGQRVGVSVELLAAHADAVPPAMSARVRAMHDTMLEVDRAIRKVVADLCPPGLYDVGLSAALEGLASRMEHEGLRVQLRSHLADAGIGFETRALAYRVVAELLRNVVKHAGVDRCEVSADTTDRELVVLVADDGRGFDPHAHGPASTAEHFGLWSIGDRVRDAGGALHVDAAPGAGCRVRVALPLEGRVARPASSAPAAQSAPLG